MEQKIIEAAKATFLKKGFKDTNMSDIAAEVGLTRPAMHYYFRTKEKLFWDIFAPKMEQVVEYLDAPLDESVDFFDRIANIIDFYFGILELDERLAPFIVNELIMHPGRWDTFRDRFLRSDSRSRAFKRFEGMVTEEIQKGTIQDVEAIDILLNIMSLTISAFIVAPKGFARDECDSNARKEYLSSRKENIKSLIINGLRI